VTGNVRPFSQGHDIYYHWVTQNHIYCVTQKLAHFLYALTWLNIDQFSNLFHYQNQENNCNNTVTKDPTTPQVCQGNVLPCKMSVP